MATIYTGGLTSGPIYSKASFPFSGSAAPDTGQALEIVSGSGGRMQCRVCSTANSADYIGAYDVTNANLSGKTTVQGLMVNPVAGGYFPIFVDATVAQGDHLVTTAAGVYTPKSGTNTNVVAVAMSSGASGSRIMAKMYDAVVVEGS